MKRVLVINSNGMFKNENGLYIYKETGKFLKELNETYSIENFHFVLPSESNDGMANFNLKDTSIKLTTANRHKNKLISYVMAYFKGIRSLFNSDFLYLFYPNSFSYLGLIAYMMNKPFGLYVRGEKGITNSKSIFLYRKAKFVLTVSPKFTEVIKQYNKNTETIKPMISYNEKDIITNKSYTAKDVYNLLFVGRIEVAKGVYELIDAIKDLTDKGQKNIKLILVGDGEDTISIKQKVKEYNIEKFVEFKGSIYEKDHLKELYLSSDIFILPTHHEGFPRVLYEAMIFGVPILTTFVGSISHVMEDNYNCFKLEVNNSSNIESNLMRIISDYEGCSFIAKNGTKTIDTYLTTNNEPHEQQFNRLINT